MNIEILCISLLVVVLPLAINLVIKQLKVRLRVSERVQAIGYRKDLRRRVLVLERKERTVSAEPLVKGRWLLLSSPIKVWFLTRAGQRMRAVAIARDKEGKILLHRKGHNVLFGRNSTQVIMPT